jgi:dTDP-4-dehydrorhamnose reductase
VETLFITGINTVVGSNLAACFSKKYQIIGINHGPADILSLAGCKTILTINENPEFIRNSLKQYQPSQIIHCSAASVPTWQQDESSILDSDTIESAGAWAEVSAELGIPFTVISSDGLFTGPWMFHKEDCKSLCSSPEAQMLVSFENRVLDSNPDTLLVRTHAFGWQPEVTQQEGWLENIIQDLESSKPSAYSSTQHASPILIEDLVERLEKGWEENLTGIYHIAGAERVCPQTFVEKLAITFGLPFPNSTSQESLTQRPFGYGLGETSLNCSEYRQTVETGMPMLHEGLEQLKAQKTNGYQKKLNNVKFAGTREKVA